MQQLLPLLLSELAFLETLLLKKLFLQKKCDLTNAEIQALTLESLALLNEKVEKSKTHISSTVTFMLPKCNVSVCFVFLMFFLKKK